MRPHFRFEDLEIWQLAKALAVKFHKLADALDKRRLYRYAEQLRAAGLSLTNNIAEGSGSIHVQEFRQFLNFSRRSLFEDASMLRCSRRLDSSHQMKSMNLWQIVICLVEKPRVFQGA